MFAAGLCAASCAGLMSACIAPAPVPVPRPGPGGGGSDSPPCGKAINTPLSEDAPARTLDLYGYTVDVAASERCGQGDASVVFTVRGHGTRTLTTLDEARACGPRKPGGVAPPECASVCVARPSPGAACTRASSLELANEVRLTMTDMGTWSLPSPSLGVCDEPTNAPTFRDIGLIIHDWAHLQRTITALAERMRAWDIDGSMRVVVQPVRCGVALEGT